MAKLRRQGEAASRKASEGAYDVVRYTKRCFPFCLFKMPIDYVAKIGYDEYGCHVAH
jgi:hypothetical protein